MRATLVALTLALGSSNVLAQQVITNPDWAERPTMQQLIESFPQRAMVLGVSGRVVVTCSVTVSGALEDCSVASATPAEWGFEAAALSLAPLSRMTPRMVDGQPVGGARVTIPFNYIASATREITPYRGVEPEQEAIEIMRTPLTYVADVEMMRCIDLNRLSLEDRAAIEPLLRQAFAEHRAEWVDATALAFARVVPLEALRAWAYQGVTPELDPSLLDPSALDQANTVEFRIFERTRELYCATHDCPAV